MIAESRELGRAAGISRGVDLRQRTISFRRDLGRVSAITQGTPNADQEIFAYAQRCSRIIDFSPYLQEYEAHAVLRLAN